MRMTPSPSMLKKNALFSWDGFPYDDDTDEDEDDDYATHATDDDGDVGCQGREQLKWEL